LKLTSHPVSVNLVQKLKIKGSAAGRIIFSILCFYLAISEKSTIIATPLEGKALIHPP